MSKINPPAPDEDAEAKFRRLVREGIAEHIELERSTRTNPPATEPPAPANPPAGEPPADDKPQSFIQKLFGDTMGLFG